MEWYFTASSSHCIASLSLLWGLPTPPFIFVWCSTYYRTLNLTSLLYNSYITVKILNYCAPLICTNESRCVFFFLQMNCNIWHRYWRFNSDMFSGTGARLISLYVSIMDSKWTATYETQEEKIGKEKPQMAFIRFNCFSEYLLRPGAHSILFKIQSQALFIYLFILIRSYLHI